MALFHLLATRAETLAAESSRLKKRAAVAASLATLHAEGANQDVGLFALYLAGTPFAEADARKLNAGGALLTRAIRTVSEASDAALTAALRRHGDLGAAAHDLLIERPQPEPTLTFAEVAQTFDALATARSSATRTATVESLLRRSTPIEAKYLLKLMLGDMRIGVKQSLIEEAIAGAAGAAVTAVRHAVMLEADLAHATGRAFDGTLAQARMTLFHPLGFMLASPVDSPEEALARFTEKPPKAHAKPKGRGHKVTTLEEEEHAAEPVERPDPTPIRAFLEDKYDGMRAQVHSGDPAQPGRVAIYSRNREDITQSFPELAEAFAHVRGIGPTILDGEILGWDFAHGLEEGLGPRALPFAILGQRIGRKKVSNEWRRQVPVIFMAFDLMVHHGNLVLDLPLAERRNRLEALAERIADLTLAPLDAPPSGQLTFDALTSAGPPLPRLLLSPSRGVESAEEIDRAYADARARSNEGIMLKASASTYQPGRRGLAWVKLKRELATLDVVITGAEFGSGRRAAFLSDYTFAVRGPAFAQTGELLNVGKAYSGLTDVEIAKLTELLKAHTLEDFGHFRIVEPIVILEVAFNNIMRSDRHASGFALRFPRIVRIRTDKPLAEIDTVAQVEAVYLSQVDRPADSP